MTSFMMMMMAMMLMDDHVMYDVDGEGHCYDIYYYIEDGLDVGDDEVEDVDE